MNERLLYRVEEVAEMLGLGRTKTYQLVASGELPSVRVGRCLRVPAHAIRRWIEEQTESQQWPATARRAG